MRCITTSRVTGRRRIAHDLQAVRLHALRPRGEEAPDSMTPYDTADDARLSAMNRFMSKIKPGLNGCWSFLTPRADKKRGSLFLDGHIMGAPRAAWILVRGPIPDGAGVLHRCNNPQCVNLDHLYLGDQSQNLRDAYDDGLLPHLRRASMASAEASRRSSTCRNGHPRGQGTGRVYRGAYICRKCASARIARHRARHGRANQ